MVSLKATPSQESQPQGAPEVAAVLLVIQGSLFLVAGLSALPFGIVEPAMRGEGLATILLAVACFVLARGIRRRGRWARRSALMLEVLGLMANLLLMVLPIGAIRGPVPFLTNLLLPAAIVALLMTRSSRLEFRATRASKA